jgi:hypothetical protein
VLSNSVKKEYISYLAVVKKLSLLPPGNKAARAKLREKFLRSASTMPKKWLLEKLSEA